MKRGLEDFCRYSAESVNGEKYRIGQPDANRDAEANPYPVHKARDYNPRKEQIAN